MGVVEQGLEHEAAEPGAARELEQPRMPLAGRDDRLAGRQPHAAQQHLGDVEHAAGAAS